jgi:hypothetical protein
MIPEKTIIDSAIIEERSLLFHSFEWPSRVMESESIQELMPTVMCPGLKLQDLVTRGDVAISK